MHRDKDSVHFLRSLLDSSADGIIFNDLKGEVIFYSKGAEQIFGHEAKEIIGQSVVKIYGDLEKARRVKQKLIESPNNILRNFETEAVTKSGEKIYISVTASLVKDELDRVIGVLGVCSDITEKRKLEDDLRKSEQKLRCLFENIREGIYVLDSSGVFTSINPAGARILGYSLKEMIGRNIADFYVNPEDQEHLMSELRNKGYVKNHLCLMRKRDGKKVYLELTCNLIKDREARMEGVFRDVTDRLKIQQLVEEYSSQLEQMVQERTKEIRDIKDFLTEVIEIANDMVCIIDLEGKCRLMNQAAERITGWKREEWINRKFIELVAPEYVNKILSNINRVAMGEDVIPQKIEIVASGGRRVPVQISARVLKRNSTIVGIAIIARDLMEIKKLEEQTKSALDELKKRYESRMEAINLAAYDLVSPLSPAAQHLQSLEEETEDEKLRRYLEIVKRNLERERNLIDHVLELSRLDYREHEPRCLLTNFRGLIEPLLENYLICNRKIKIQAPEDLMISAEPEKLQSALDHLLSRAVGNTPEESEIVISAEDQGEQYLFKVADKGQGIPKEKQLFLFEKIYLGDKLSEEELKNKIDLLLAKHYVEFHGGRIWVESEVGEGSTFCFTIPKPESLRQ